jgi:hypothetical protein
MSLRSIAIATAGALLLLQAIAEAKVRFESGLEGRLDWRRSMSSAELLLSAQPSLSWAERRRWQVQLAPRLRADLLAARSEPEAFDLDGGQSFAELSWGRKASLRAGSLRLGWGLTDIVNPLDLATQRDLTDVLNISSLGWLGVVAEIKGLFGWSVEIAASPWTRATILPGRQSRWLPRDLQRSQTVRVAGETKPATILLPTDVQYVILSDQEVGERPQEWGSGFRLQRRSAEIEVQLVYFRGLSPVPALELDVSGDIESQDPLVIRVDQTIGIRPLRYQRQAAGVGLTWTLGPVILRLAASASDSIERDPRLGGWSHQGVLQLERSLQVGDLNVNVLGGISAQRSQAEADTTLASLERVFDRGGLFGMRIGWSDQGSLLLGGVVDLQRGGSLVRLALEHRLAEGFVSNLNIDLLDGTSTSPTGVFRAQDRVSLGLSAAF